MPLKALTHKCYTDIPSANTSHMAKPNIRGVRKYTLAIVVRDPTKSHGKEGGCITTLQRSEALAYMRTVL